MAGGEDVEVRFDAADGWSIGGLLRRPAGSGDARVAAAVLVPGSRHERDAYTTLADALAAAQVASLRIDIRGRGSSRGERTYARMAPGQRRRVALDVVAALDLLASMPGIDSDRLGFVGEQDTAADALDVVASDARLRAVVLLSARYGRRLVDAVQHRAVFGLVSKEDRDGLRATVGAYLVAAPGPSRIEVLGGLGFGTTMFSTRQFEHGDAEPLETMIAGWLGPRLR
jgi:dienelactone hydrolase